MGDELDQHLALVRESLAAWRSSEPVIAEDFQAKLDRGLVALDAAVEELRVRKAQLADARRQLGAAQRRYGEVFEDAPDAYVVTDRHGVIRSANARARRLLNLSGDTQEVSLETFVRMEDRPSFRARLSRSACGVETQGWELSLVPRSRPPALIAADLAATRSPAGDVVSLQWLLRDITEARRAQTTLQEAFASTSEEVEQLREADEWKNALLAAAAHDLRAPLATIRSAARELEPDVSRRPEAAGAVAAIQASAHRLESLLTDLLDLDRLVRGVVRVNRTATDVAALVTRVVEESSCRESVTVSGAHVRASVDVPRMERLVGNLVSNACGHTPLGTPVWVSVAAEGTTLVIEVEDAGPGVPEELRGEVFAPFVTRAAHPADNAGTGIGLALVHLFAELHGGKTSVTEGTQGGARFVVRLPAAVVEA